MADDIARIARGLTRSEADLLCGRCTSWGSWMFEVGEHLVSLGLGAMRDGSITFDSPIGLQVREYLENNPPHSPGEGRTARFRA